VPRPPDSLRKRLLFLLLGLGVVVWGTVGTGIWIQARHEVEEVFDANLSQTARLLLTLTQHELKEAAEDSVEIQELRDLAEVEALGHRYDHKIAFQICDRQDAVLLHSPAAPAGLYLPPGSGFLNRELEGHQWRLFRMDSPLGSVHVGIRLDIRDEMVRDILQSMLWPMLASLLVAGALIWWAVGRGLQPLEAIVGEVEGRGPEDLNPLSQQRVPQEIRPLVYSLNGLLQRLGLAFENERRFTSDASHELRTPLAAIRIQAQVAQRAEDAGQRRRALAQILNGVDRAGHLVEQLLTLARADSQQGEVIRRSRADLRRVARIALEQSAALAVERGIELEYDPPAGNGWEVAGDQDSLAILLRNLIDNAVRYTPAEGRVRVWLERQGDNCRMLVEDDGPGIPEGVRERVFQRFQRGNHQATAGSGLGLSIVRRIADLHGAGILLAAGEGGKGLRIAVELTAGGPPP
jgi:two-component system, OmpR family, sensor histidine kinase QseC